MNKTIVLSVSLILLAGTGVTSGHKVIRTPFGKTTVPTGPVGGEVRVPPVVHTPSREAAGPAAESDTPRVVQTPFGPTLIQE